MNPILREELRSLLIEVVEKAAFILMFGLLLFF